MATVDCQRCGHPGRAYHFDGPCTHPGCVCRRLIVPMSSARYQQLLDWLHEGKDLTNINGDDLPSILLSYEQVLAGVFALITDVEELDYPVRSEVIEYRKDVLWTINNRLRTTFGLEED